MTAKNDLVTVSTFRSVADAQVAKGILDESGVESLVRSDNAGGMYPALDSVDLLVRADDVEKATEALTRRHRRTPSDRPDS
jgi:hypothetical protein